MLALPAMLVSIDVSVMILALPHIGASLGADSAQQLWILGIYGFMLAGFMITTGTLGDRIGRRKLLMIGAAAFGIASTLAAFSPSAKMLIGARPLLGIAGATAVGAFAGMVERARKYDGCLDLSISADSVDPDRIKEQFTHANANSHRTPPLLRQRIPAVVVGRGGAQEIVDSAEFGAPA